MKNKFKAGDKVKVINWGQLCTSFEDKARELKLTRWEKDNDYYYRIREKDTICTVVSVDSSGYYAGVLAPNGKEYVMVADGLALAEKHQFKVGEKVRVIADTVSHKQPVGSVITLGNKTGEEEWKINGSIYYIIESDIERIEDQQNKPLVDTGFTAMPTEDLTPMHYSTHTTAKIDPDMLGAWFKSSANKIYNPIGINDVVYDGASIFHEFSSNRFGFKVGDKIVIKKAPKNWSSALCKADPTGKEIYPFYTTIEAIRDESEYIAMKAGDYGWSLTDLVEEGLIEKINNKNNNKKIMSSIKEFAKNLVLSKEEKLLRESGLKDSCGNYTQDALDLVINKLVADNEAYLVDIATKKKDEEKKSK